MICIRFFGVFVLCGRDPFLVVIGSAVLGAHLQRRGKFRGIQPRKNSCYLGWSEEWACRKLSEKSIVSKVVLPSANGKCVKKSLRQEAKKKRIQCGRVLIKCSVVLLNLSWAPPGYKAQPSESPSAHWKLGLQGRENVYGYPAFENLRSLRPATDGFSDATYDDIRQTQRSTHRSVCLDRCWWKVHR